MGSSTYQLVQDFFYQQYHLKIDGGKTIPFIFWEAATVQVPAVGRYWEFSYVNF